MTNGIQYTVYKWQRLKNHWNTFGQNAKQPLSNFES